MRPALRSVRVPTLVLYRDHEYLREASALHGRAAAGRAGRRGSRRRPPAVGGRPEGGARPDRELPRRPATTRRRAEPDPDDRARGRSPRVRGRAAALGARPLPRPPLDAPPGRMRASFDGPARAVRCATALADTCPPCARASTPASASCATGCSTARARGRHRRRARRPPGEILATSTVQDLVAGSGIEFDERGSLGELRCSACCADQSGTLASEKCRSTSPTTRTPWACSWEFMRRAFRWSRVRRSRAGCRRGECRRRVPRG